MDLYINSLIQTMGGENLNGMKIILTHAMDQRQPAQKNFPESWC